MKLADKLKYLREVEGSLRGLNRAMTQQELVRAIAAEMETPLSQSYLSQIESGARPHLTNTTRLLLAKFFKVHPGYLVEDPEGYHAELLSDLRTQEDQLDLWLIAGSDRFRKDPELCHALRTLAMHDDSRRCLLLLESVLETPALVDRLLEVLRPEKPAAEGRLAEKPVAEKRLAQKRLANAKPKPKASPGQSSHGKEKRK
jgi:transcriptional regulator with XRE-family HTH domain